MHAMRLADSERAREGEFTKQLLCDPGENRSPSEKLE